jgi:thiol-disulfide isomerase/thioredoxin
VAGLVLAALLSACSEKPAGAPAADPVDATIKAAATKLGFAVRDAPSPLPALRFAAGSGAAVSLENFRGKVVLLNLWATWCSPCRDEMPTLDRLQAKLGGPEFDVLALSIDHAGIGAVKDFYQEIGLKHLAVYVDPSAQAMLSLNVLGIPITILVDREGRELARLHGVKRWDSAEMVEFLKGVIDQTKGAAR